VEQVFNLLIIHNFIAKKAHERSWIRQNSEANRYMPVFYPTSALLVSSKHKRNQSFRFSRIGFVIRKTPS